MPCLAALIVLAILGLFSATHRKMAKEAFDCVFRRVTLRPCTTGFDSKMKAKVQGKLLNRSPWLAKFVGRHFEALAWLFMLLLTATSVWTARGIYNYWAWGNCNGAVGSGFCAFDPTGKNNSVSSVGGNCQDTSLAAKALTPKPLQLEAYPTRNPGQSKQLVFIGCYACEYTRKTWPMIKSLVTKVPASLTFIHFPAKPDTAYLMAYDYCVYRENPAAYWQLTDLLFGLDEAELAREVTVKSMIKALPGVNEASITACVAAPETRDLVDKRFQEIEKTGIYGTPTVFVNGTPVVGPKPERVYRRLLNRTWL